jgi:cysteinyl-tRNA synthetase
MVTAMKLTNTYTGNLEEFVPLKKNEVSIYVCGPTVYNYIHIGNARPVVFFDTLRRYFEAKGYRVLFASNFTDVDDRIIARAKEMGLPESRVSEQYIEAFLKDIESLNCLMD